MTGAFYHLGSRAHRRGTGVAAVAGRSRVGVAGGPPVGIARGRMSRLAGVDLARR
jgi:hypothetical protein